MSRVHSLFMMSQESIRHPYIATFFFFFFVSVFFLLLFVLDHPHAILVHCFQHNDIYVMHSPLVSSKRSYLARRTQSRNTANMVAERR